MGNFLTHVGLSIPNMLAAEGAPEGPNFLGFSIYVGLMVAVMFGLMASAKPGLSGKVFKSTLTSCFEQLYLFIENMCLGAMGNRGRKYLPMVISFWMIIFTANVMALFMPLLPITLMIFVIEIISEMMKNLSLTLRLFGNIHGGHQAVEAMNKLGSSFFVPFGSFLLPVKILTCVVQALIFTVLTCVYLSLVTHHEEEGHEQAGTH